MERKTSRLVKSMMGFFVFGLTICLAHSAAAASTEAIINETQKSVENKTQFAVAWWMPDEFWTSAFAEAPDTDKNEADQFMKVVKKYTIVVMVEGKANAKGVIKYTAEKDVRARLTIKDGAGTIYKPIPANKLPADAKEIQKALIPIIKGSAGEIGPHMFIYFFPGQKKAGGRIADASKPGSFTVSLGASQFQWKLPLPCLAADAAAAK